MFGNEGDSSESFGSSVVVDRAAFNDVQATGGDVSFGLPLWFIVVLALAVAGIAFGMATGKIKTLSKDGEDGANDKSAV